MSGLSHFEIFGDQPEKLAELYRALFDWRIEKPDGIDYWRIMAADDAVRPLGGLARRPSFDLHGWLAYFQVPSVAEAIETVERHGGQVLKERTAVPRTAWYAVVRDPAGNAFAVWEPDPLAFPTPEPD